MIVGDCRSATKTKYTVDERVEEKVAKRVKEEEGRCLLFIIQFEHEISAIGASFHIRRERE